MGKVQTESSAKGEESGKGLGKADEISTLKAEVNWLHAMVERLMPAPMGGTSSSGTRGL